MTITLDKKGQSIYKAFIEMGSSGDGTTPLICAKGYYHFDANDLYIGSYRHEDIVNIINLNRDDNQM